MRALLLIIAVPTLAFADAKECAALGGKWLDAAGTTGCLVKKTREGEFIRKLPGGQVLDRTVFVHGKREGPSVEYFENCQLQARGSWHDDKMEGPWVFMHEDGKKDREGPYTAGKENGVWTTYHPETGTKHLEGPYVMGQQEGEFTEYLPRGEKWRTVVFHKGVRAGPTQELCATKKGDWEVDFKQKREGCVIAGLEEGPWTGFDGNGKTRWKAMFKGGRQDGTYEEFHPTGELLRRGEYKRGTPTGRHVWRSPDGVTEYGASTILDGTGRWKTFHPNGKPAEEGAFQDGCPIGDWKTWTEEGRLTIEEHYEDCRRNGTYTWFHTNGQRRLVGHYSQGMPSGSWQAFYSTGDPEWTGQYDAGRRSGDWKFWRWGKQLRAEGPMDNDVPNGVWTEYGPTGKPSETGLRIGLQNEGPWKTYWTTGEPWREVEFEGGQEQNDAAMQCSEYGGVWAPDAEKRTLGCLVCRAHEDDTIEMIGVGLWTYWHPSGGIEKQGTLVEGKPSGAWKFFHDNGAVMMRGSFDGGVEEGAWSGAWRTGAKRFEGDYREGKPQGTWTSWKQDGSLLSVGRYEAGKKVGAWKYVEKNGPVIVDAGSPLPTGGEGQGEGKNR